MTSGPNQDQIMTAGHDLDALIQAVVSGIPAGDEGQTAQEIADRHGKSKDWARKWLRRAVRAGVVTVGQGYRRDTAGRVQPVPVYRGVVVDEQAGSGCRAEPGIAGAGHEGRAGAPL